MSNEHIEIQNNRIHLSSKHYITISVAVVIILWIIGSTFLFVQKFEVSPLKNKIQNIQQQFSSKKLENDFLSKELSLAKSSYNELLRASTMLVLLEPSFDSELIGNIVELRWDYKKHSEHQKYIVEIKSISGLNNFDSKFNSLNPEKKW